ncbi:ABC transporter substrate-binding protein [Oceanibacterium hippocampi]|uniref:Spermidine/putrescine-binding periplasmic protein n=1 Tax=Oceanibacterium hippocampi TaxID=745714 RepID=A0A1Y5TT55_9PROT|nr:ABC transporter substrate-binding protein [Oceanibacterium hippocampi]SLN71838.1 Spermidine/putrescine-binding periplasmic protein precursor [Oceanibacterium hippocampi]
MGASKNDLSRRQFVKAGGGALAALASASAFPRRVSAAETLTVADAGGSITTANDKVLYEPFRQETGIDLRAVAREHEPISQVKAMVESNSYVWDVCALTKQQALTLDREGLLEPLDWSDPHMQELIPAAKHPTWMAHSVYASILGYRKETFGENAPQSWADFWNVDKFPGRRALRKHPVETLEIALMADGVPLDKIYPMDLDRAFASLDRIKPHIHVWWTGGAQSVQLLQSGEIELQPMWSSRLQSMIDSGAPVASSWNQGVYAVDGWGVLKGTPRAKNAVKLVSFFARTDRQTARATLLTAGPTNPNAIAGVPEDRRIFLPTYPSNLERMLASDDGWWIDNRDAAIERFNTWILG